MKTHLTSIADHSDWLDSLEISEVTKWNKHRKRVEFGKQPLELWMFNKDDERCLFEGFENSVINDNDCFLTNKDLDIFFFETGYIRICCRLDVIQISTIEDLIKYNLELTATAQK